MTVKNRERGINMIIALIVSFSGVFMAFKLNDSADREKVLKQSIELKADKTYVDDQNNAQNKALKDIFLERDKVNIIILEELGYIKRRVDRIPTK